MDRALVIDNLFTAMLEGRKATLITTQEEELHNVRICRINERQNVFGYKKSGSTKNTYIWRIKEVILA